MLLSLQMSKDLEMWSVLVLLSVGGLVRGLSRTDPLVSTNGGQIRGQWFGDGYAKFLGVPYAVVDENNPFGPSVPHHGFDDIFEAYESKECPQLSGGVALGTIDCLTMDIYVPSNADSVHPLPVMVWIYGGAWIGGSSQRQANEPVSLLKNDVIIVAINYRTGIYGFMCLDTPEVPGNQGLKDQTLALRWVQENIAAFGGDIDKITIFGHSAGGMSVNLHLFSLNEKLFNQAIIQGGPALSYWMMVESNNTIPLTLAHELGFTTTDINTALNFLSSVDPHLVVQMASALKITSAAGTDQPLTKPCVEKIFEGVENFITEHPMNVKSTKASGIPIIIGHNVRELAFQYANQGEEFFGRYDMKMLFELGFDMENDLEDALNTARHFYVGDEKFSTNVSENLVEFGTDIIFGHPTQRMAEKLFDSGAENVYRFVFSYLGAGHGHELSYLFDYNSWENDSEQLQIDKALVKSRLTTLWTNFAKYGNPTPAPSELLPFTWTPITKTTQSYLNMDLDFTPSSRPDHARMAFWDLFYKLYGKYQKWYPIELTPSCNNGSKLERNVFISIVILLLNYLYINNDLS